jgi:uncharacterized protein DUF6603
MFAAPSATAAALRFYSPTYEEYNELVPKSSPLPTSLNLVSLFPSSTLENLPVALIPQVTSASFLVSSSQVSINGILSWNSSGAKPPSIHLETLTLGANYDITDKTFDLSLEFCILLYLPDDDNPANSATNLRGSVNYDHSTGSGVWTIAAEIQDLQVGTLYDFFEPDSQDIVMNVMHSLTIDYLNLSYSFGGSGNPDTFTFDGMLSIAQVLQLHLTYNYPGSNWTFVAILEEIPSASDLNNLTFQDIANDIDNSIVLPDFIGNAQILPNQLEFQIKAEKTTISDQNLIYVFTIFELTIEGVDILYIQYSAQGWTKKKTVFRAAITKFPDVASAPVLGTIPQPFDEMYYLYVAVDPSHAIQGISQDEFNAINTFLDSPAPLIYKAPPNPPGPSDPVITPGSHFVIALNVQGVLTAVLDYAFTPTSSTSGSNSNDMEALSVSDSDGSQPAMAPMQKTIGPLSISNVGLQYKNQTLSILLDATVNFGPIAMEVIGFSIGVQLDRNNTLQNLPTPHVTVAGLGVSYNQPPTIVTGEFLTFTDNGNTIFAGGVDATFSPYSFVIEGCYGQLPRGVGGPFNTVALFGKIQGPLIELEFAEITAICGGFGYNSALTSPTIDNVTSPPFIGSNTNPGSQDTALDTFSKWAAQNGNPGWVTPTLGAQWYAAGLTVTAFQTLQIDAVVVVDVTTNVILSIFGECVAQFPPKLSEQSFVYAELGILSTIDFNAGVMNVLGKLSPRSYIFDPNCHLTGEFAMGYWFGDSDHAGDWVFSVGGYHPAFTPPSYYPTVDRLAISWTIDSSLSATGNMYIAITPKVCMAGASIQVSFVLGKLSASFQAWADFLLNYQPFYFTGDIGVNVSVQYTLDLWICTKHISIDLGANLTLKGPPTHGTAHVDFWVFGFTISFGSSADCPLPLDLAHFYSQILLQQGKTNGNSAQESDTSTNEQTVTCLSEQVPGAAGGNGVADPTAPWTVRAGDFSFRVKSVFAMGTATVESCCIIHDKTNLIFSKAMQTDVNHPIESDMTVTISDPDGSTMSVFSAVEVAANVPTAVWGVCKLVL